VAAPERRDLQGLTVTSASGHIARSREGGMIRLDGSISIMFDYRDSLHCAVVPPGYAEAPLNVLAPVLRSIVLELLPQIDLDIDTEGLVGSEV